MQVSWIEPDELRALASKLLEPQKSSAAPAALELHTLAEFSPVMPGGMIDGAPEQARLQSSSPSTFPQSNTTSPDIATIREKLRAIRDRAKDAGLLPSAPVPVAEPASAPAESVPAHPTSVPVAPFSSSALAAAEEPPAQAGNAEFPPPQTPAVTRFLPLEGTIAERLDSFAHWALKITSAQELVLVDDHGDSLWGVPSRNDLVVSTMLALSTALRSGASQISSPPAVVRSRSGNEQDLAIMPCLTQYGTVTLAVVSAEPVSDDIVACLREGLIQAIDEARVS